MRNDQQRDLKSALQGAVQRRSSDRGVTVREQTRRGAERSRKLLDVIASLDVTGRAVTLTRQSSTGTTQLVCVCGLSACNDGSVAG